MMGILCFLIVVVLGNILQYYIENPVYHSGVSFVNENFWLLILIAVILLVGDLFGAFPFPLDLPAPIIRAVGSVFVIAFILRVFQWTDTVTGMSLYPSFWLVSFLVVPLVFLIVLGVGYAHIMRRLWHQTGPVEETGSDIIVQPEAGENTIPVADAKSWEEIGAEFRMMLYDIIHRFRQEIKKK